jgi:hypothetical protein
MSEDMDALKWSGIPQQLFMPPGPPWSRAPSSQGARDANLENQPSGPGGEEEGGSYYVEPFQYSDFRKPRAQPEPARPGFEVRVDPGRRRKIDKIPVFLNDADKREAKVVKVDGRDYYDIEPDVKLKPKHSKPSPRVKKPPVYGGDCRLRVCPSNYTAMEIHGFFGLIDDGPSSSGRMLIVHVPSWIKGYFLDLRDGDNVHAAHVNGSVGGVLRILAVGRHKYYSPGSKVSTCTICVPEEQWERFMNI